MVIGDGREKIKVLRELHYKKHYEVGMKYRRLEYSNKTMHPQYWQTLEEVLNSEGFYSKFEFVQVLKYDDKYCFTLLVREK